MRIIDGITEKLGLNSMLTVKRQSESQRRKRKMIQNVFFGTVVVVLVSFLIWAYFEKKTYHNYKVLTSSDQEDVVSTKYDVLNGKIFRYNTEGVTLMSEKLEKIWYEAYSMNNPVADIQGTRAVIADKDGTALEIFDKNGRTGSVATKYSIVKAKISASGVVAVILESGEDAWINLLSPNGDLIAEMQTKIDDPGYPMDVSVSNDGTIMMVAYQYIDGSNTTSYVAFYNFGSAGRDVEDHIVSGYTYEGTIVPQVEYMHGNWSASLKDNGVSLYRGKTVPEETVAVEKEGEIVSVFCDEKQIGLVYKNDDKNKAYILEVYDSSGKKEYDEDFNIPYTKIKFNDGNVLMHNSSQIRIINKNGNVKYQGEVDGSIRNFIKIGWNKYLLVLDSGIEVIKLKG